MALDLHSPGIKIFRYNVHLKRGMHVMSVVI